MTPIDDINPGDFIALVRSDIGESMRERAEKYGYEYGYTGEPLLVEAISLPFVAIRNVAGRCAAIDVRVNAVQKLNSNYVDAMRYGMARNPASEVPCCPMCGDGLVDRDLQTKTEYKCLECGFRGVQAK